MQDVEKREIFCWIRSYSSTLQCNYFRRAWAGRFEIGLHMGKFFSETGIPTRMRNHLATKLCEKLFDEHRRLDFHRYVLGVRYRKDWWTSLRMREKKSPTPRIIRNAGDIPVFSDPVYLSRCSIHRRHYLTLPSRATSFPIVRSHTRQWTLFMNRIITKSKIAF